MAKLCWENLFILHYPILVSLNHKWSLVVVGPCIVKLDNRIPTFFPLYYLLQMNRSSKPLFPIKKMNDKQIQSIVFIDLIFSTKVLFTKIKVGWDIIIDIDIQCFITTLLYLLAYN